MSRIIFINYIDFLYELFWYSSICIIKFIFRIFFAPHKDYAYK